MKNQMKRNILFSFLLFFSYTCIAQQAPEEERTLIPYEYPQFRDATVTMMFGSQKQVKANIYLDGSKFYFMNGKKAIEADLSNIRQVQFGDTTYIPQDTIMARIVVQDSTKMLICIKTIDKYKMTGRNDGFGGLDQRGEGLPFFQLDNMMGSIGMIELNDGDAQKQAKTFPLKRTYYFIINGEKVPAKESRIMRRYSKEQRKVLKGITENRHWSWSDERSLAQLLGFL